MQNFKEDHFPNPKEEIPHCEWFSSNFYTKSSKIKFLGQGSFGKVFHVISRANKAHNAMKVLIFTTKQEYEAAKIEIKLTMTLKHKNIIKIEEYHFEKLNGGIYVIYLVLELARESLKNKISRGFIRDQISFHSSINQVVQAIKYCHEQDIVHFDIKPDNILIFSDEVLKVADWGSAKPGLSKGTFSLKLDTIGGTRLFASPELLDIIDQDPDNWDSFKKNWQKMDIYAMGMTFLNVLGVSNQKISEIKGKSGKKYENLLEESLVELFLSLNFQMEWVELFKSMLAFNPKTRFNINEVAEFLKSMKFMNNQKDLIEYMLATTGTLDLLFVLDTTGSMDYYIEAVLKSLNNILLNLKQSTNKRKINIGCLFYKDLQKRILDENIPKKLLQKQEKIIEDPKFLKGLGIYNDYISFLDFTPQLDIVEKKLKKVKCFGGDDYCEDLVEALKASMEMSWTHQSTFRIMVIITDAPPHGKSYSEDTVDYFPEKDEEFDNLEEMIRRLVNMKIGFLIVEIDKRTRKANEIIEKICQKEKGFFQKVVLEEIKDPKYMGRFFEKEVINEIDSIFKNQWDLILENKIKENINWDMQIDWEEEFDLDRTKDIKFKVYDLDMEKNSLDFNNLNLIKMNLEVSSKWDTYISKNKVLEGNLRNIYLMMTQKSEAKYVIKLPKDGSYNMIEELMDDWKNYMVSHYMAKKFKKELRSKGIEIIKNLEFLTLTVLESENSFKGSKFFACEKFLDGIFVKYNSNLGWVLKPKDKNLEFNDLVQAFSHFSFHFSKGKIVIVDIQGVKNVMTDPAIQSLEQIFGSTDLGRYGIYKFLRRHQCTKICKKLNLNDISKELELLDKNSENCEEKKEDDSFDKDLIEESKQQQQKNGAWLKQKNSNRNNFSLYNEFNIMPDPCESRLKELYHLLDYKEETNLDTGLIRKVDEKLKRIARIILQNNRELENKILKSLQEEFNDDLEFVVKKYNNIRNLNII